MLEAKREEYARDTLSYTYMRNYVFDTYDMVYTVKEASVPLISCVYAYHGGAVEIKDIVSMDDNTLEDYGYLILMPVLNSLDLNGINDVYSSNTKFFALFKKALFEEKVIDDIKMMYLDLTDYFIQHSTK